MQEIKFTITIEEARTILLAIGNLPFNQVYALIGKLKEQAEEQIGGNGQETTKETNSTEPSKIE